MIGRPYSRVSIYFTDKSRWIDSKMCGKLSIIEVKDLGPPLAFLRLEQENLETGEIGLVMFEFELPLNMRHEELTE